MVYSTLLTFRQAVTLIEREQNEDAETITQRDLDKSRVVNEIIPYLMLPDHFIPPLIVEASGKLSWEPVLREAGYLCIENDTKLLIRDGQHRLEAIRQVIELMPEVGAEQINVVILPFKGYERSQMLFADINRNAKPVAKSIGTLMDRRSPFAAIARHVARNCPILKGRVSFNLSVLKPSSGALYTLHAIEVASKKLAKAIGDCPDAHVQFWQDVLSKAEPIRRLHAGSMRLSEVRSDTACPSSAFLEAIAVAAITLHRQGLPVSLVADAVGQIDWHKDSKDMQPFRLPNGRLVARTATFSHMLVDLIVRRAEELALLRQASG